MAICVVLYDVVLCVISYENYAQVKTVLRKGHSSIATFVPKLKPLCDWVTFVTVYNFGF